MTGSRRLPVHVRGHLGLRLATCPAVEPVTSVWISSWVSGSVSACICAGCEIGTGFRWMFVSQSNIKMR